MKTAEEQGEKITSIPKSLSNDVTEIEMEGTTIVEHIKMTPAMKAAFERIFERHCEEKL